MSSKVLCCGRNINGAWQQNIQKKELSFSRTDLPFVFHGNISIRNIYVYPNGQKFKFCFLGMVRLTVEHKLHNFEVVLYIIRAEWEGGNTISKHRFSVLHGFHSRLMAKLPERVRRGLPMFPSKKVFKYSILTIEKRRLAIEQFFRACLFTRYIQKRMHFLRPVGLHTIVLTPDLLDPRVSLEVSELKKRTKSIAYVTGEPTSRFPRQTPTASLPLIPKLTSPNIISSLRAGSHRNFIPETLGPYTLRWQLANGLEPQTSFYFASQNVNAATIKLQHQENGNGTLGAEISIYETLEDVIGVPKYIEFVETSSMAGLVLEAIPTTVSMLSDLEFPLPLQQFLSIAMSLTETLDQIHSKSIAFGALCPLTIWYDEESEQTYLLDFSLCQIDNCIGNDEEKEWSNILPESFLPYIAPEHIRQSRIGNSGFRADLYSLGIVLFEILTGRIPFDCTGKEELLYAQLAQQPHRADEISADVPVVIGAIIDRLLQKEPSQRYSTAHGVYSDLALCQEYISVGDNWKQGTERDKPAHLDPFFSNIDTNTNEKESAKVIIPEFQLGRYDYTNCFSIPDKLYQRDHLIRAISASFESVEKNGEREMILLRGPSGSGKTALIAELLKQLPHDSWFSISLEFSQENISSLVNNSEYLQSLFTRSNLQPQTIGHQILSRSKFEVDQWRDKLSHMLNSDGQLLLHYIPSLREVLGPKWGKGSLPLSNDPHTQGRKLSAVLCKFLTALAGPGHPLLLVLDSMQWANQQMIQLFTTLSSLPGFSHVVFLLSFRTDDPHYDNKKLHKTLQHCEKRNMPILSLSLDNLSLPTVKEIIEDSINVTSSETLLPLAKLVHRKTCGNPLFVCQLLRSLYNEGLLRFDDIQRKWIWDSDSIQQKPYTPNVIEFMVQELEKLSAKQRELLHIGSCIGSEFDLVTLTEIISITATMGRKDVPSPLKKQKRPRTLQHFASKDVEDISPDHILRRCLQIVQKDLLAVVLNPLDAEEIHGFAFVHERILRASNMTQSSAICSRIHFHIGSYWLKEHREGNEQNAPPPFHIVRQLNLGRSFITDNHYLMELVLYNQSCAQIAAQEGEYENALQCAAVALELLKGKEGEDMAWKNHHSMMMEFSVLVYGHQESEQKKLFETLAKRHRSKLELVTLYSAKLEHQLHKSLFVEGMETVKDCLSKIIEENSISTSPTRSSLLDTHNALKLKWPMIDGTLDAKPQTDIISSFMGARYVEEQILLRKKIQRLLSRSIDLSFQMDPLWIIQFGMQSTTWSLQWGITEDSLTGIIIYGVACIYLFHDISFGLSIETLLIQLELRYPHSKYFIAQARLQWFHYWRNYPLSQGLRATNCMEEELWECYRNLLSSGQNKKGSHVLGVLGCNSFHTSNSLEQCKEMISSTSQYVSQSTEPGCIAIHSILSAVSTLQGEHMSESNQFLYEFESNQNAVASAEQGKALHFLIQMISSFLLVEVSRSHKAMYVVKQHISSLFGRPDWFYFHFWSCLIVCASIETYKRIYMDNDENTTIVDFLGQLDESIGAMQGWNCDSSSLNFGHCITLVEAERFRIRGQHEDALTCYRLAITQARTNGYIAHEAVAHEQLGTLLLQISTKSAARYSLLDAIRCYQEWGAKAKVSKLEAQFKSTLKAKVVVPMSTSTEADPSNTTKGDHKPEKQMKLIFTVNELLQSSMSLGGSLTKIWKEICIFSGTTRGCLALIRHRQLEIEIDSDSDSNGKIKVLHALHNKKRYCNSVLNYVTTSQTPVIIDDCQTDTSFQGDSYIRKKKIRSLFCIPILFHNHLIGIFYLENSLVGGLFSSSFVPLFSSISLQLAVSIRNFRLSETVARQTAEINLNASGASSDAALCKSTVYRRMDNLLGQSWEKCSLLLLQNHLLIHSINAAPGSIPLARYAIEDIQDVDQISSKDLSDSQTAPSSFILRLFLNSRKFKLHFAMKDIIHVEKWIKGLLKAMKQQPDIELPVTQHINSDIQIWEDEIHLGPKIGSGATSAIYSATWHGMKVAVKQFHISVGEENTEFLQEVKILQSLRHPSLILFLGAYFTDTSSCVVTELMKGDLYSYLKKEENKPIPKTQKVEWVKDIVNGMIYLHSFFPPIVHRDLKSHNILLDETKKAKICDFGLAKRINKNMTGDIGTPAWMAPEVFASKEYETSADVYSFGIVLWEILTESLPFQHIKFSVEIGIQVSKGLRPPIPSNCDPAWQQLLEQCWCHDPHSRPSFRDVLHYIEANFE